MPEFDDVDMWAEVFDSNETEESQPVTITYEGDVLTFSFGAAILTGPGPYELDGAQILATGFAIAASAILFMG